MAISQLLVRHGYEVIYLGRFNTPERLAAVARQEDADLIGVSVHSWEFTAYAGELVDRCRALGIGLVFGGSVLTEADRADLLARGADAVLVLTPPKTACSLRSVRSWTGSVQGRWRR